MSALPRPPFQGRIRGVAGGQVGEQKAPAGFFLPSFNPGLAVTARSPPPPARLCAAADGCSARGGVSPSRPCLFSPPRSCGAARAKTERSLNLPGESALTGGSFETFPFFW